MAESSFRSFRREPPPPENEPSRRDGLSDPLAELARLIGQGGGQDSGHQPAESYDAAAPAASEFDWASVNENDGYTANGQEDGYDQTQEPSSWPLDEGYENERSAPARQSFPPARSLNGARGDSGQGGRSYDSIGQPPAQSRAQPFPFIPSAPDNGYRADSSGQQHAVYSQSYADDYADDDYDDEQPRRGGTVVIAALVGLAVLGTAGALGYRAITGGSVMPSFPPIIKPADGPIRVKPDQQAQASNSGQADSTSGAGERVVTNQEQPVDVQSGNSIPRMIKTIPVVPNGSPDPAMTGGQASVAQTPVPPPGYAEPVVPSQPFGQVPTVNRPARVPPPSAQQAGANTAPTASVARPPVVRAKPAPKPTVVAESPSAGGPLSLVPPQEGGPSQAPARVRTATSNPAAPVPSTSAVREAAAPAGAGYVQVSSQRSEAEAQSAYRDLQAKFPQQLGGRHAVFRRADLGDKGIFYRALVGPFATAEQATTFCSNLKAAGGNCFTQRN
jgi:SPOR domain